MMASRFVLALLTLQLMSCTAWAAQSVKAYVCPGDMTLRPGTLQQFQVFVVSGDGSESIASKVIWKADPKAGTISKTGLFTAGKNTGVFPDGVCAVIPGGGSASASIEVFAQEPQGGYICDKSWGNFAAGHLNKPMGVAVDKLGNIYAADTQNHRIQVFDINGNYRSQWGSYGSRLGQFNYPSSIAIGKHGLIYVADRFNNRVQAFNPAGKLVKLWGTQGTGNGQFNRPLAVAVDTHGFVYVTDDTYRIQKFDPLGKYVTQFNLDSRNPTGLAIDLQGNMYVSTDSSLGAIYKYDPQGRLVFKWGSGSVGDGQLFTFGRIPGIAVDRSGYIYITNNGAGMDQVYKLDPLCNIVDQWGTTGSGNGEFYDPFGIALDASGNVYVTDIANDRIQKFDGAGNYLAQYGWARTQKGQFCSPSAVTADSDGNVYVADSMNHRIQKFDRYNSFVLSWGSSGEEEGQFEQINGIACDNAGSVYALDDGNQTVSKFNSSGNFIKRWGLAVDEQSYIWHSTVCAGANGKVYVLGFVATFDSYNDSPVVKEFDSDGNLLKEWSPWNEPEDKGSMPRSIAVDSQGCIYFTVVRYTEHAAETWIEKFDTSGVSIAKWGSFGDGDGQFGEPQSIAISKDGKVFVGDSGYGSIQMFDEAGNFISKLTTSDDDRRIYPYSLTADGLDNVYTVDYRSDCIRKFTPAP